jgi:hypothetical protein
MNGMKWFLKIGELSDASIKGVISSGYELIDCQYGFYHGADRSGKVETNTRLHGINLVYDGLPSKEIIKWAMGSVYYLNGALVLYDANDMPVEKIFFEEGACTGMRISYIADGDSYASTMLTVYPRIIKIDDNVFRQPWTVSEDLKYQNRSYPLLVGEIGRPIGKTNARLQVGSGTYELEEFDISFRQDVDYKGQPIEEVCGGIMSCTISGLPPSEIKKWAISSSILMDGTIDFYQELQSSPLKILFTEAYCLGMVPFRHSSGEMRTRLTISANDVDLNGKSIFKNWKF